MAAVLPTLISSQGDDSGGQYTERPCRFARSVRSQGAGGKEVAEVGPCAPTARFWPWVKVSVNRGQRDPDLLVLPSFRIPFLQELPVEEDGVVQELIRYSLLQRLLIGGITVEYPSAGVLDLDHDDHLILGARVK